MCSVDLSVLGTLGQESVPNDRCPHFSGQNVHNVWDSTSCANLRVSSFQGCSY